MLKVYNSIEKKIQIFKPRGKTVLLYTCGPTLYSRPHIGNYRTYVWEDLFKKYLIYKGYRVRHIMNITDYDNTVMKEAIKRKIPRQKLVSIYEKQFMKDILDLEISPADDYPHVSEYINEMARLVKRLLEKGLAYKDEKGRVFFDISKFKSYGKLIGKRISNEKRVELEDYRPSQAGDFIIWLPCNDEKCSAGFETILGGAHPPWNIQCAAISRKCLGNQIDMAMGGIDNRFNHHENTRALASSISKKEYAKYWIHIRHLIINGKKMSKSKGNDVLLPDMKKKGFFPRVVRFIILLTHYRKRLNFTWGYAKKIKSKYFALTKIIKQIKKAKNGYELDSVELNNLKRDFESAMDFDLDAPKAIRQIQKFLDYCKKRKISKKSSGKLLKTLKEFDKVLSCLPV